MLSGQEEHFNHVALLSAQRLRRLVDNLPALIAHWDSDLSNVLANVAFLEWYGLRPEQVKGKHIRDILSPEQYEQDQPFIAGALRGNEYVVERELVDAAGVLRHTQTTYLPDRIDGDGRGFFVVDADITPWVEATRALDEAQALARLGSSIHDLRANVIVWTDEHYRIFGETPSSFVPTVEAIASRVHPDDLEEFQAAHQHARRTGHGYSLTYRIVLPDATVREVRGREKAQEGTGEALRIIGTVQDMTEINAAAHELARINTELARVNAINADVLAMVGHDIRAPLTAMLGNLEMLVEDWETTSEEDRIALAQRLWSSAQRMADLAEDILSMAAAEGAEVTQNLVDVNVADAVGEALAAIDAEGTVRAEIPPGLFVRADVFQFRQIITNLVTDALRYGEPPVVAMAAADAGATVTIRVRDHGHGVPADQVPDLFSRFAKRDVPHQQKGAPNGFGLYIAARMAGLNGGTLRYEASEPGACFALTLPAAVG